MIYKNVNDQYRNFIANLIGGGLLIGITFELKKLGTRLDSQVATLVISGLALTLPGSWVLTLVVFLTLMIFIIFNNKVLLAILSFIFNLSILSLILLLRNYDTATQTLILVIGAIIFDSMSYFTGTFFGKNKIAKSISPAKTVEGFLGGCLFYYLFYFSISKHLNLNPIFYIFPLVYFVGDLLKSKIKRVFGIKDFSNFFGPHGGFLDRFDSHLYACIYLKLIH